MSSQKTATIQAVETLIQYKFGNTELLWEALQSSKVLVDSTGARVPPDGNKRLAIVGDAAMQLTLAEGWYKGTRSRAAFSNTATAVGSNANLNRIGLGLGLERFIAGSHGGKTIADTVEAILGAIYLDSNFAKVKDVMDALDLVPKDVRLERQFEMEGLVMLDNVVDEEPKVRSTKRQRTDTL